MDVRLRIPFNFLNLVVTHASSSPRIERKIDRIENRIKGSIIYLYIHINI